MSGANNAVILSREKGGNKCLLLSERGAARRELKVSQPSPASTPGPLFPPVPFVSGCASCTGQEPGSCPRRPPEPLGPCYSALCPLLLPRTPLPRFGPLPAVGVASWQAPIPPSPTESILKHRSHHVPLLKTLRGIPITKVQGETLPPRGIQASCLCGLPSGHSPSAPLLLLMSPCCQAASPPQPCLASALPGMTAVPLTMLSAIPGTLSSSGAFPD